MNPTLEYLQKSFRVNLKDQLVEIPNTDREFLASIFKDLGFTKGVEIGVERGLYSEVLCRNNPGVHLFSVDAWTAYKEYRDHVTQTKLDGIYEEAKARLKPYNAELIKGFSMDVVKSFPDNYFDFVYIDGNHEYQHVVDDITQWTKKVRPGGIVAGHDYVRRKTTHQKQEYLMHVIPAIHGYMDAYQVKPLFILGSKAKIEGERRDSPRSWFFVKPEDRRVVPGYETNLDK